MFDKGMMDKLESLKKQAEESKEKLSNLTIEEEAGGGLIRVEMDGNRELKSVKINTELNSIDKDELEDLICVAISRVLVKVNTINEQEVMNSTQSLFPGL